MALTVLCEQFGRWTAGPDKVVFATSAPDEAIAGQNSVTATSDAASVVLKELQQQIDAGRPRREHLQICSVACRLACRRPVFTFARYARSAWNRGEARRFRGTVGRSGRSPPSIFRSGRRTR
jgi:hypothetical protein